jgi:hypothetical protein
MGKMEKHSSVSAYIAAGFTALFGGITLQDVALVVGILTAVGTFVINWYYKEREADRFERLEKRGAFPGGRRESDHTHDDQE